MRRHPIHDYKSPSIYHITLKKAQTAPIFSTISGVPERPVVALSPIGKVLKKNLYNIPELDNRLNLMQYIIMPDHVHFLLRVVRYLDDPLGIHISKLKINSLQMARDSGVFDQSIFESNFHDRFLRKDHSLDTIFQYIRQNPYRLLIRRFYPDYFRRINNLFIFNNIIWQAYGNMHLLSNPFKEAVVCHRADAGTPKEEMLRINWIHTASNGGVLVSPFISEKEKGIRDQADAINGKIILITNESFGNIYKPSGRNFQLCEEGRLLIIAPQGSGLAANRKTFLLMNMLAEWICGSLLLKQFNFNA